MVEIFVGLSVVVTVVVTIPTSFSARPGANVKRHARANQIARRYPWDLGHVWHAVTLLPKRSEYSLKDSMSDSSVWSRAEIVKRFHELLADPAKLSYEKIAELLSGEFGVFINKNMTVGFGKRANVPTRKKIRNLK